MKAKLYSFDRFLGSGNLSIVNNGSFTMLEGILEPSDDYFSIRDDINQEPDKVMKDLRYSLQFENGYFPWTDCVLGIRGNMNNTEEKIKVSMLVLDAEELAISFIKDINKPFLGGRWTTINIKQKLRFEEEILIETGQLNKYNLTNLIKPNFFKHKLINYNFSALAKAEDNDDVLFHVRGPGEQKMAVVHLTWSQKEEKNSKFPVTTFYQDFSAFREKEIEK